MSAAATPEDGRARLAQKLPWFALAAGGLSADLWTKHLVFYPAVLLGLFWIYAPPLATLPGLWFAWTHRREPASSYALWLTLLTLVVFCAFGFQGARFVAAPATALTILSAVASAGWLERLVSGAGRCGRAAGARFGLAESPGL